MKKLILLSLFTITVTGLFSQSTYRCKNRYVDLDMEPRVECSWWGRDDNNIDVTDSTYLTTTGVPDYGDLYIPDLEVKMKAMWFGDSVYFLFRYLDDSLVTDIDDAEVKPGMENLDATTLYFFTDSSDARLDSEASFYKDGSYIDSILWIRYTVGTSFFEGEFKGQPLSSLEEIGGELVQWSEDDYHYAKLKLVKDYIFPGLDTLEYYKCGFVIEQTENDKEVMGSEGYELQTRAFWGSDMDSNALNINHIPDWRWLYFTYGDTAICETPSGIYTKDVQFASVFPNPANDVVTITQSDDFSSDYLIVDLMGRTVKSGKLYGKDNQIIVDDLWSGTYFIKVTSSTGKVNTLKLMKY